MKISEVKREYQLQEWSGMLRERKEKGKYRGRKATTIPNFETHYRRYMSREISKAQFAKELNISRPTLDKLIAEYQQ